jgi:hypothetical protein
LIVLVLVLAFSSAWTERAPGPIGEPPVLAIDPCVGADEETVGKLLDLELRGDRDGTATRPESVTVRCVNGAEEIRVNPWAALDPEGVRMIQLPSRNDADPAARQGRSRELALAIAELIRRLGMNHPAVPPEPAVPALQRPPADAAVVVAPAPLPTRGQDHWQVGAAWAGEAFGGGTRLIGGDVMVTARLGRWLSAELRAGGRVGREEKLALGRLTKSALTGSAAVGLRVWPRYRIGFGFMLRAQGYILGLRAEYPDGGGKETAALGALALGAEPILTIAVARHLFIQGAAGVGYTVHGAVVRVQGIEAASLAGVWLSGSLGLAVAF